MNKNKIKFTKHYTDICSNNNQIIIEMFKSSDGAKTNNHWFILLFSS